MTLNLVPGAEVGPYRVIERVGRGGMASVYKAHQAALARYVALKVLPDYLAEDKEFTDRFQHEAVAVANLRHPNIPAVYDYGQVDGTAYIVTEFIDGGTLTEQMGKPLPAEYTWRILGPIASALDYAHSRGVLHRDVKPSNIMLTRDGRPILNDFGLARMMEADTRITQAPTVMGTPQYMAPEQCAGEDVGPAADIYSLAVVAYEMITGQVPYQAATPAAVMMAHMHDPLPPPRTVLPAIPDGVEAALLKGLAKKPGDRYGSATALVEALAGRGGWPAAPAQLGGETTRVMPAPPAGGRPRWLLPAAAGLGLLLLVAAGAWLLSRQHAGGQAGGGGPAPSASARAGAFGTSWEPGAHLPEGPAVPRGPEIWRARFDGTGHDFDLPDLFGGSAASVLVQDPRGYVDIALLRANGHVRLNSTMPPHPGYIAEATMAVRPGSRMEARWIIRGGDAGNGDHVVTLAPALGRISVDYVPPKGGAVESANTVDHPELFTGRQFTLTADVQPEGSYKVYLDQEELANFGESRNAPGGTMGLEAFGSPGEFRVLELGAWQLP